MAAAGSQHGTPRHVSPNTTGLSSRLCSRERAACVTLPKTHGRDGLVVKIRSRFFMRPRTRDVTLHRCRMPCGSSIAWSQVHADTLRGIPSIDCYCIPRSARSGLHTRYFDLRRDRSSSCLQLHTVRSGSEWLPPCNTVQPWRSTDVAGVKERLMTHSIVASSLSY